MIVYTKKNLIMFNGIVFNTGKIKLIKKEKNSTYIAVKTNLKFSSKDLGSSVSCNGACLTLTKIKDSLIIFYISKETLIRTNFNTIKFDQLLNLEKSLSYGQKISGHFTQGHVDTVAVVKKIKLLDKAWLVMFKIRDKKYNKFIVEKASISINGVSLTISKVSKSFFEVNIIPHTLKLTNIKDLKINDTVNVELDIFSKYIYKYSL
ncbi:riboflavin synthase [Pelagibacteraceae bacterium]|jgi:riboflavin synthase|nr:riboflavin synthase [Pelagibacteraceae bacterium]